MSSHARALRPALPPALAKHLTALRVVLTFLFRLACVAAAIWLLVVARTETAIQAHVAFYIMALACVYIALGATSFRVWVLYLTGFILFAQLRGFADGIGTPVQFDYAISAERALFLGEIPSIWLQERLYSFARLGPLEFYTMAVYLSYFFVPHVVAFALWKWDRPRFKTYVFAFMVTLYAGLLVSALLPTAPPWMAGQLGYIPHVYQVVPDIAGHVTPGTYENVYEIAGANPVAAMPSLHVAVPGLIAFALWKYNWLRWFGVGYAISMLFAVVYLGEHYAVDGFAGLGLAAAAWVGLSAYLARREASAQKSATEDRSAAGAAPSEPAQIGESIQQVTGR
ncbi:MAG: inositol phosphorylceramide synthase [Chloroflexi bacterium]|nr:inositol phosphorylceramide synthase [Chloroflexota bacterium]